MISILLSYLGEVPKAEGVVLISQQRYLPFGGIRTNVTIAYPLGTPNSPNTDYGYTGQRNLDDDIGLMDYKARFYSPVLNRFIQPDSIVPNLLSPQMFNRFSYVGNNPVNFNDPTGHLLNASSNICNADGWCGSTGNGSSNFVVGSNSDGHDDEEEEDIPECGYHHCPEEVWDIIGAYELGWQNYGQAWSIVSNPNSSMGQRFLGSSYMVLWAGAHLGLYAGLLMLGSLSTALAVTLNVTISVGADAIATNLSGKEYTWQQATTTAIFSLALGTASSRLTRFIGTNTPGKFVTNIIAQSGLFGISDAAYRGITDQPITPASIVGSLAGGSLSGILIAGVPGANINAMGYIAEAQSSVFSSFSSYSTFPQSWSLDP
jgi:RHS repeat-associated protein